MRLRYGAVLFLSLLLGETTSQGVDDGYYYRLTNTLLGDAYSLDTAPADPNLLIMAPSSNSAGQFWKVTSHDGCSRLTNVALGSDRSLDNSPTAPHAPRMGPTGNYTGECWHLAPEKGGYMRLTNDYLGNSHSLDTQSTAPYTPFMAESSTATGQFWKLTILSRR